MRTPRQRLRSNRTSTCRAAWSQPSNRTAALVRSSAIKSSARRTSERPTSAPSRDWIAVRRLLTNPGYRRGQQLGGGPTKEFEVQDSTRASSGVSDHRPPGAHRPGQRERHQRGRARSPVSGQQSVNIRGVGLIDDGGADDLTKGYRVDDIENVVLTESNGVPILVRDVATVMIGNRPRLGVMGRDSTDDVVGSIVVMNRDEKTADMIPKVKAEIARLNSDGSLPPGVRLVPYYDRSSLIRVTTHTVLHNLILGCLLVFLVQWVFLGDLRSAILVGVNIPFALLFAVILLVWRGESASLLSVGAVDFGIIVDSAVILVENVFRVFQSPPAEIQRLLRGLPNEALGGDPTADDGSGRTGQWTSRLTAVDRLQHRSIQTHLLLHADHGRRVRTALHDPRE